MGKLAKAILQNNIVDLAMMAETEEQLMLLRALAFHIVKPAANILDKPIEEIQKEIIEQVSTTTNENKLTLVKTILE